MKYINFILVIFLIFSVSNIALGANKQNQITKEQKQMLKTAKNLEHKRQWASAMAKYQEIISKYPKTKSAEMAQHGITNIQKRGVAIQNEQYTPKKKRPTRAPINKASAEKVRKWHEEMTKKMEAGKPQKNTSIIISNSYINTNSWKDSINLKPEEEKIFHKAMRYYTLKQYSKTKKLLLKFKEKYPNSQVKDKVDKILNEINQIQTNK